MRNFIKYLPVLVLGYLLLACSSSESLGDNPQVEMTSNHIDAWLNLMPGTTPGTFHFVGEIKLKNNGDVQIDSLEISNVTVFGDSEVVYTFKPEFNPKPDDSDFSLKPGTNKIFKIRTGKGLKVNEMIIKHRRINLKLELKTNLSEQFFEIKNIKVQRAY